MTFCTQSAQLLSTAAKKPMVSNFNSEALHRMRPATTGTSVRATGVAVRSLRISRAKITVKAFLSVVDADIANAGEWQGK